MSDFVQHVWRTSHLAWTKLDASPRAMLRRRRRGSRVVGLRSRRLWAPIVKRHSIRFWNKRPGLRLGYGVNPYLKHWRARPWKFCLR